MNTTLIDAPPSPLDAATPARGGGRPYRTGICALLLSFAIASGAATTGDAFAQSNTDRLVGLVDTTNRNGGMLEAIQGVLNGLGEQIGAVQTAISALSENVSALSGDTAATAADMDGLTGKVDAANERIAGLDGKADAIGTGVVGLTGKVADVNMRVDGVGSKVDTANMRINELAGKVDAANACAADLNARVDALGSSAAELSARMGSAESGAAAVKAEVEGLKTAMAGHANANRLDPSYAEKLDMISDIRAALDALGDRPDNTAAYGAISDGIKANSASIAALEDTINRINSQLAGVTGKLDTVETAVERNVGPAPTSLHKGTEKYTITLGHLGDSARGKVQTNPNLSTTLTATYAFSCKADAFIGKVELTDNAEFLWGGSRAALSDRPTVATVEGRTLWHSYFDTGSARTLLHVSQDFNLMELKAGSTLDFSSSWRFNHTNGTGGSGLGNYIVTKHGETVKGIPIWYFNNATFSPLYDYRDKKPEVTKAIMGAATMHKITVEYYSPAEKAECSFKRTSGFSAELDKKGQKVLSVPAPGNNLVNGFEGDLDCNGLPTVITGINTEIPGGLSLNQHSTFQLLTGSGDKEKTLGVFKFNPNGTITHASGDFPFTFEGSPLTINGTLAGASSLLVVVDYKTSEDNFCR